MVSIFTFFAEQPVLMLFILIGVGMLVGHIKLKGVSLGAAAVLFLAIFVSAWAETLGVEIRIPGVFGVLGLAVFAFAIGVNSGPSFFHNIKTALGPILATVALYIVAAGAAYGLGIYVFDMDIALVAGTFAGALTNTPALAAAEQA